MSPAKPNERERERGGCFAYKKLYKKWNILIDIKLMLWYVLSFGKIKVTRNIRMKSFTIHGKNLYTYYV